MKKSKSSRTDAPRRGTRGSDFPAPPDPVPGTVTAIQSQARDPNRVNAFVDGEFSFGIDRDVATEFGLDKDHSLDEAALADLLAREQLHKATNTALNFLAYRPRAEGEIRKRLRTGGYPEATIEFTLERLREWKYVDDEDFARRWIENRAAHRPRGARQLAQELRAKGIDQDVVSGAIDECELDELADALAIARVRNRQLGSLEPAVRDRRLSGYLARRGYGYDVIRSTLNTLRDEEGDSE